jgi:hypothetical protein
MERNIPLTPKWTCVDDADLFLIELYWNEKFITYGIEGDRVVSKEQLLGWCLHLLEKSWCTTGIIKSLIQTVSKQRGWNFHGL